MPITFSTKTNNPPFVVSFVDKFIVPANAAKDLMVGKLSDDETPDLITLHEVTLSCDIPNTWFDLPQKSQKLKEIRLFVKVPEEAPDNTCFVSFVINDNDPKEPMNFSFKVKIEVVAKKFEGVVQKSVSKSFEQPTGPKVIKASIDAAGNVNINFSKNILVPSTFYNLTSENEGPTYFNVTLIVAPQNLEYSTTE